MDEDNICYMKTGISSGMQKGPKGKGSALLIIMINPITAYDAVWYEQQHWQRADDRVKKQVIAQMKEYYDGRKLE